MMLAKQWLQNARSIMDTIEETQMENIQKAALLMADTIEAGRWVHTFGCGHATIPIEEMYPRIGGFVGFHPMIELPLTFFTNIVGGMSVHNFVFLERVEGYGTEIMKGYNFDPRDCMWLFSHTGINALGLRQLEGIDLARIERQYDVELGARIEELRAQGLIERDGPRVRLAPGRLTVSNEVFVALLD